MLTESTDMNGITAERSEFKKGNNYYSIPLHTPLCISELGGRTQYRLAVKDAGGENEGLILSEILPSWVTDVCVEVQRPDPQIF